MTKVVNYHTTLVDKFTDIDEDILKIAVCDMSGIKNSKDHFINKWSDRASVLVSGELVLRLYGLLLSIREEELNRYRNISA